MQSKTFRFVVIDEAFGRGSDESARFGLELFRRMGLQLLVVTPLQKIHIIEPFVKALTGGDRITARRMRMDFYQFDPTHQLVMQTNHKPRVTGTDEGIWRRLRLIPFTVTVPPDKRDARLSEKLQAEFILICQLHCEF